MRLKGENRILLHLKNHSSNSGEQSLSFTDNGTESYFICQKGIAESTNLSISRTSRLIKRLVEENLLKEELGHVKGLERRRKVYYLTKKGQKRAKEIQRELEKKKVTVKTNSSQIDVELGEIGSYINSRDPLMKALNNIDDSDVIDLTGPDLEEEDIFAGRSEELEFLTDQLEKAIEGDIRALLIRGKAGIGKTRLVNEFKQKMQSEDLDFLIGKGYFASSEPFLPFKDAFNEFEDRDIPTPMQLAEKVGRLNEEEKKVPNEFIEKRDMIFSEISEKIKSLAEDKPIVIFVDNLQWADRSTLMLFHYLVDKSENVPVLLMGAYIPEEVQRGDFLNEVLHRLNREDLLEELKLDPLKPDDIEDILKGVVGRIDLPEDFVKLIHESSEGNPLFLKELTKQMLEDGTIDPKNNKFPKSIEEIDVPEVVKDITKRRIKNLNQKKLKILRIGSIIGEEVPYELLHSMSGMDAVDLLEHTDILTGTGILRASQDEEVFCFEHGLIQRAIYERIPKPLKQKLHRQVAESMENEFEVEIEEFYSDIGFHYKQAEEFSKACKFYCKAGEKAERLYSQEVALEMYEEALKVSKNADLSDEKKWKIYENMADIYKIVGSYKKSEKYYKKIPKEKLDSKSRKRIARKTAEVYEKEGNFNKALDVLEEVMAESPKRNVETARVLQMKGWIEMSQGKYIQAIEDLSEALKISKKNGDEKDKADIFHALGTIHLRKSEHNKALSHLEKSLKIRKEIGDLEGQASSLSNMGIVYLRKEEVDKASELFQKSLQILEKIGDKCRISKALLNIGTIYLKEGEMEKAYECYEDSNNMFEEIGHVKGLSISLNNIGNYYLMKDDLDKALEYYNHSLKISEHNNFKYGIALAHSNLGIVYANKEKKERAKEHYLKSIHFSEEIGDELLLGHTLLFLAEFLSSEGEFKEALEKAKRAWELSENIGAMEEIRLSRRILGNIYVGRVNEEKSKLDQSKLTGQLEKGRKMISGLVEEKGLAKLGAGNSVL